MFIFYVLEQKSDSWMLKILTGAKKEEKLNNT